MTPEAADIPAIVALLWTNPLKIHAISSEATPGKEMKV